jgi:alkylation response protein AidB-like acyl-CoA dehydrogenase
MANFLTDNEDLQYYLQEGIDWEPLVALTELGYRSPDGWRSSAEALAFYRDTTSMVGELVADEIAPHGAQIDREGVHLNNGEAHFGPRLQGICEKISELGLHGLMIPRELGGMNAPVLVYFINAELLARADVSLMTHYGFHGGMAMAMLMLSALEGSTEFDPVTGQIKRTRFGKEIAEIAAGKAWGSMDITEPDAGSDMAALRSVGEKDDRGRWTVSGQKIFITSGHGKYHFVIARTEKAQAAAGQTGKTGLDGLSLFMVPAYQDGPDGKRTRLSTLDRVEEKLGHHGSATVAITFDRTPAELMGRPGEGFRYMLEIMNHARLGVGFESIGLCEAALRMAKAYAAERRSMGKTIDQHEMIADYLDEMELDVVALRALAMHAGYHEELGQKQQVFGRFTSAGQLDPERLSREAKAHRMVARRATPLLKYLAAEKAVEMARRCLQIHGGNGYMTEFGAEKLLRDSLVMPIYEGTSQIQSLMAMKDTLLAITRAPQEFIKKVAQTRWRSLSASDPLEKRVAKLQLLSLGAQQHLVTRLFAEKVKGASGQPWHKWPQAVYQQAFGKWNPKTDFRLAMLHAERLTRLLADEQIVEVLLEQAKKHPHRRPLLERYLERAEPRARFLHTEITSTGARLLAKLAGNGAADQAPEGGDGGSDPTGSATGTETGASGGAVRAEAAE